MRGFLVQALAGIGIASGASAPAQANDWGCEVLLCLSNPGGPTQYGACRPAIRRLQRALAQGDAFPRCSAGNVVDARNDAGSTSPQAVTLRFADGTVRRYRIDEIDSAEREAEQ